MSKNTTIGTSVIIIGLIMTTIFVLNQRIMKELDKAESLSQPMTVPPIAEERPSPAAVVRPPAAPEDVVETLEQPAPSLEPVVKTETKDDNDRRGERVVYEEPLESADLPQ